MCDMTTNVPNLYNHSLLPPTVYYSKMKIIQHFTLFYNIFSLFRKQWIHVFSLVLFVVLFV